MHLEGEPLGVALAFANAGLFAAYIVLAHRVASDPAIAGIDGLAARDARRARRRSRRWRAGRRCRRSPTRSRSLAGIGVGISSSVIPYVADQVAMARLTRAAYALMVSLLPATATVVGLIVLTQVPSLTDALGIALVIAGVALHREPTPPPAAPPSPTAAAISCSDAHSRGEW